MNTYGIGIMANSLLLVCCFSAAAEDLNGRPPGRMGPPPEAIAACKGKSEGTSVQFTTPRNETLSGVCRQINGTLAAVPEGFTRGPQGSPPDNTKSGQ